jgi:hypothetical protein
VINAAGGIYTALVVVLFAVVKFTEGAWLIVIIFPLLVYLLIRLNREYRAEAAILADPGHGGQLRPAHHARRVVLLLVDNYDLATVAALRYARGCGPPSSARSTSAWTPSGPGGSGSSGWTRAAECRWNWRTAPTGG